MKKAILVSLFIICCGIAQAQVRIGINVCPQINEDFGLRTGTDIEVPISQRWSFTPGIYWSLRNRQQEGESTKNGITTKRNYHDIAHFISIPARFSLHIPCKNEDTFALKVQFGPYVAYGINGTSKTTTNKEGEITYDKTGAFDSNGRYKGQFDYGLNIGLNSTINKHFTVGFFNEYGFRKIYKSNNFFEDLIGEILFIGKINIALGLTIGYQF